MEFRTAYMDKMRESFRARSARHRTRKEFNVKVRFPQHQNPKIANITIYDLAITGPDGPIFQIKDLRQIGVMKADKLGYRGRVFTLVSGKDGDELSPIHFVAKNEHERDEILLQIFGKVPENEVNQNSWNTAVYATEEVMVDISWDSKKQSVELTESHSGEATESSTESISFLTASMSTQTQRLSQEAEERATMRMSTRAQRMSEDGLKREHGALEKRDSIAANEYILRLEREHDNAGPSVTEIKKTAAAAEEASVTSSRDSTMSVKPNRGSVDKRERDEVEGDDGKTYSQSKVGVEQDAEPSCWPC